MARRLLLVLGALLTLLVGGVAGAGPASAHAALVKADPRDDAVVKAAPEQVRLWFSEGVLLSADSVKVLGPDGRRADSGDAGHIGSDSATASVGLGSDVPDGSYVVVWKAVSADTHPVSGAFTFSIGAPSKTSVNVAEEQQPAGSGLASVLYGIGRYISYAGYALLVGGCVFVTVCWPRGARLRLMRRIAVIAWTMLVVGTTALIMLRGPYVNGGGLGRAFDLDVIRAGLATKPGSALVSRLLLLAAAAVFVSVLFGSYAREDIDASERRGLAWGLGIGGTVLATGLAGSWALSEHASVGLQAGLAMPVDMVHLVAMAVWLGGLVALLAALTRGLPVERDAVLRFSRVGFIAVCALAATGLYQGWRQVGSWSALFGTEYGRLLLVKIALVVLLVGLARLSRRWTHRLGTTGTAVGDAAGPEETASPGSPRPVLAAADTGEAANGRPPAGRAPAGRPTTGQAAHTRTAEPGSAEHGMAHAATAPQRPGAGPDVRTPERKAQLARQAALAAKAKARRERDADVERGCLRRSVLAEVVVAVAVLAVTTVLTGTRPGRAEEEQRAAASPRTTSSDGPGAAGGSVDVIVPFDTGGKDGRGDAQLTLGPARSGAVNVLHLLVTGADGKPRDVPEVRVSFTLGAKRLGPLRVTLTKIDTGHWGSDRVSLPIAGMWTVSVIVRTSDIDETTETKNVEINP
jgi:copper transport protein